MMELFRELSSQFCGDTLPLSNSQSHKENLFFFNHVSHLSMLCQSKIDSTGRSYPSLML